MPTAKSYENMPVKKGPYEKDGKMYVIVTTPKNSEKEVRWYTDSQRVSMDKRAAANTVKEDEYGCTKFNARRAFGFNDAGYITIVWGNEQDIMEWRDTLPIYSVLHNLTFGYFIPSENKLDVPKNIDSFQLTWDEVKDENDPDGITMKPHQVVGEYVHTRMYGQSISEYQGEKDEWLEREVIIEQNISGSSMYNDSHTHIMKDKDGNVYVWTTATKDLAEGNKFYMKMKVKEHKEYKGVKQTVVYYCKIK